MPQTVTGENYREFSEPRFFECESISQVRQIRNPVDKAHAIVGSGSSARMFKYDASSASADNGTSTLRPSNPNLILGCWLEIAFAGLGVVDVTFYGATGDGVTNDTAAFERAIAAASTGDILFIPPGTYILDDLDITKDLNVRGVYGRSILKHKAAATADMITTTAAQTGVWEFIVFDGNGSNQTTSSWFSSLRFNSHAATIHFCIFRNSVFAGIAYQGLNDSFTIRDCKFLDLRESLQDVGKYCSNINFITSTANNARILLEDCLFENSTIPTVARLSGCGATFSRGGAGYLSVQVRDCTFRNLGLTNDGSNHLSPLDFYGGVNGISEIEVSGCEFYNTMAQPDIRCAESRNIHIHHNKFFGARTADAGQRNNTYGIAIQPAGNTVNTHSRNVVIEHNQFLDYNVTVDTAEGLCIYIQSVGADQTAAVRIEDNLANNVTHFFYCNFEGSITNTWDGPIRLARNVVYNDGNSNNDSLVVISRVTGTITLESNYLKITGGNGLALFSDTENNSATFVLIGNTLETTVAQTVFSLRGVGYIIGRANTLIRPDGGTTHTILQSGGNLVHLLDWVDEYAPFATTGVGGAYTFADIEEVRGLLRVNLTATPEGLINARPGLCEIISVGTYLNGYAFRKSQGGALGNTGWVVAWSRLRIDQNAATTLTIQNTTSGTGAACLLTVASNDAQGALGSWSPAFTDGGNSHLQDAVGINLESNATRIAISAKHTGQDIRGYVGNSAGTAIERFRLDQLQAGSGETPLWLYDGASMRRVTLGANDSGGAGFRLLRVVNA
jgi:hypothetical protein